MMDAAGRLLFFLERIRRRLLRRFYLEAALRLLAWGSLLYLITVLLFIAGLPAWAIRGLALTSLLAVLAGVLYRYVFRPRALYSSPAALAAFVESRLPAWRDRLVSGAELAVALDRPQHYSADLARAAVETVIDDLPAQHPERLAPLAAGLATTALAGAVLVAAAVAVILLWPAASRGAWSLLWGSHRLGVPYDATFLAGDIELNYVYPAYTGLDPLDVPSSSGDIEAYPGTRVHVKVRALGDADEAVIVQEEGGDILLERAGAGRFEGEFTIAAADAYHFEFDGEADLKQRKIALLADQAPSAQFRAPAAEVEVRETDQLELSYQAADDFGLTSLALVFNFDDGKERAERRVILKEPAPPAKQIEENWLWDLAPLAFKPGDRVTYYLEAADNDSVNGPKTGRSPVQTLKVFSIHEHHQKLIERQEMIWEAMIGLLAKYLEQKVDEQSVPDVEFLRKLYGDTIAELSQSLVDPLAQLLRELADDPLATEALMDRLTSMLQDLRAHEQDYRRRGDKLEIGAEDPRSFSYYIFSLAGLRQETVRRLEQYIMEWYELLQKQKYDSLVSESEKLAELRDRLRELLEKYKQSGDPELKRQIEELLKEFRDRLKDVMARMSQVTKELPEEFINLDALPAKNMAGDLSEIEKLLEQGNLEQALSQLDQLSGSLNDMLDQMKEGSEELGDQLYSESMKKLANFQKDLEQLIEKETELNRQTQAGIEELRRKMNESLRRQLSRTLKDIAKKVAEAESQTRAIGPDPYLRSGDYRDAALERIQDLKQALQAEDVANAQESAGFAQGTLETLESLMASAAPERRRLPTAQRDLARARRARELLDEVRQDLERALPDPAKMLSPAEQQRLQQMARMQQQLAGEGQRLRQDVQDMSGDMPFMPGDAGPLMENAAMSMERSRGHLQQLKPGPAEGSQQEAIHSMQQLKSGLDQALQQMQQASRFGGLRPILRGQGGEGGQGFRQEKVAIPQAEDHRSPKELREDILEAMKRKAPEVYDPQNRQYYKELVK